MSGRRGIQTLHGEEDRSRKAVLVHIPMKSTMEDSPGNRQFCGSVHGREASSAWGGVLITLRGGRSPSDQTDDRIGANKGKSLVLGIGTVTGPCHTTLLRDLTSPKGAFSSRQVDGYASAELSRQKLFRTLP